MNKELAQKFANQLNIWLEKDYTAIKNLFDTISVQCNEELVKDDNLVTKLLKNGEGNFISSFGLLNGLLNTLNSDYSLVLKHKNDVANTLVSFEIMKKV